MPTRRWLALFIRWVNLTTCWMSDYYKLKEAYFDMSSHFSLQVMNRYYVEFDVWDGMEGEPPHFTFTVGRLIKFEISCVTMKS
jgi:hypothetical protein